jgi:hypothetical protein
LLKEQLKNVGIVINGVSKKMVTDTITVTITIIKSNQKRPWYKSAWLA